MISCKKKTEKKEKEKIRYKKKRKKEIQKTKLHARCYSCSGPCTTRMSLYFYLLCLFVVINFRISVE